MSKPTTKMLLPKLRFPEFQDAGKWEDKLLGEVTKYVNGKAHEQDIAERGDFIVVNSKFISTNGEVKKFTNIASCIAEKEDILMVLSDVPNGRAIAKCFFVDADNLYTVNQRICKLTPNKAVSTMLFYSLNRKSYFLAFDDGVKQTNLKKDDVLNCPIFLPKNHKEQQKIADCLSSIDELITAHTKKHRALKAHKKGLMQQLFPAEGKTVPKLRFPEFTENWFQADLSQHIKLISGTHLAPNEYDDSEAGNKIPYFTGPSDFINNMSEVSKWTSKNKSFASSGDTLLTVKGSGVGQIMFLELAKVAMGRQLMAISATPDTGKFIFYCLALKKQYFEGLASGNMIPGLARPDILTTRMFFPKSNKEQKKIAYCLSSIDNLITTQAQKIESLKTHKKGLMQQLFPTVDEVNG